LWQCKAMSRIWLSLVKDLHCFFKNVQSTCLKFTWVTPEAPSEVFLTKMENIEWNLI
jgi:hypothetical protein